MKLKSLALAAFAAATLAGLAAPAFAQQQEQFVPVLSYRTGAYAPNGAPWANGFVDYIKLTNARGGINGVKITYEECETGYDTARSVECYERLKSRGASFVQPLSTGATFAITEKAPARRSRWSITTARTARSRFRCCRSGPSCSASSCSCCP
jgi:branched-chain amino acid transport system substrate-binding protein